MDPTVIVLVVVVVLLVVALAIAGMFVARRRRSEHLQEHFGPEYERLAGDRDPKAAEAELAAREKRHRSLDIRPLDTAERDRFEGHWAEVQRGFVDDPARSLNDADRLVVDIMRTRGYPVDEFDQRADDISVEHPDVVHHYREARRVRDAGGRVDTEDQRHAVTSYRSLVQALLTDGDDRGHRAEAGPDDRATSDRGSHERTADSGARNHRTDKQPTDRRTDEERTR